MKEIGSEFWDVSPLCDTENNIFPSKTQWYLSGRTALSAIIQDLKGVKSVALPSWCCESMIKPFIDANIKVLFYPVIFDKRLIQTPRLDCDAILIMDYFGYTDSDINLGDYKGIVIRDLTHSIFSKTYTDSDYYFGSLRKWCGVYTGGFAWTKDGHKLQETAKTNEHYIKLRREAMGLKQDYIKDISTTKNAYLDKFAAAETILETNSSKGAADMSDISSVRKIDIKNMAKIRRENATVLKKSLSNLTLFDGNAKDCPMFVPIHINANKRDALRKKLTENNIYCPIHWPISKYHKLEPNEQYLYKNTISLVCDQRYSTKDMDKIVSVILNYLEAE